MINLTNVDATERAAGFHRGGPDVFRKKQIGGRENSEPTSPEKFESQTHLSVELEVASAAIKRARSDRHTLFAQLYNLRTPTVSNFSQCTCVCVLGKMGMRDS